MIRPAPPRLPGPEQVVQALQQARSRIEHGWPSIVISLGKAPLEALARVETARTLWGKAPAIMPPAVRELAPCAMELRAILPGAQKCAEMGLAWEDPAGLTRTQALCVLHLAVVLAEWDMATQRVDHNADEAQRALEAERRQRTAEAARRIWGSSSEPAHEPPKELRSLRDLAHVADAFNQWEDET